MKIVSLKYYRKIQELKIILDEYYDNYDMSRYMAINKLKVIDSKITDFSYIGDGYLNKRKYVITKGISISERYIIYLE